MATTKTNWINRTGLDYEGDISEFLGFIYKISRDDWFYIGRKQFWSKRGKRWVESDWRKYKSSSNNVKQRVEDSEGTDVLYEVLAVFTSKSSIRYAETLAIITSKSYIERDRGLNWSFDSCKGVIRMVDNDEQQMKHLEELCNGCVLHE